MRTRHPLPHRIPIEVPTLPPTDAEQFRSLELAAQEVPSFPQGIDLGDPNTPPEPPTGLTAEAGIRSVMAEWDRVDGLQTVDGAGAYEVELAEDSGFTVGARAQRTSGTTVAWTNLTAGTTYYVRVRAIQGVDNVGDWSASVSVAADGVTAPDLPPDSSFIRNVPTLPALPDAEYPPDETVVFNQEDGKLYRNVGDTWTASVASVDIDGQITMSQIADGAIGEDQIADFVIGARKFNTTTHNLY